MIGDLLGPSVTWRSLPVQSYFTLGLGHFGRCRFSVGAGRVINGLHTLL